MDLKTAIGSAASEGKKMVGNLFANPYPALACDFSVTILPFITDSSFSEVSGIESKIVTQDITEGGNNFYKHKLPIGVEYSNLVLKRGLVRNSPLLMGWIQTSIVSFTIVPSMAMVRLLDSNKKTLAAWSFVNVYPVAVKISEMKAQEGAVLFETIELAYSAFLRIDM